MNFFINIYNRYALEYAAVFYLIGAPTGEIQKTSQTAVKFGLSKIAYLKAKKLKHGKTARFQKTDIPYFTFYLFFALRGM